jgi:hypothetical protein
LNNVRVKLCEYARRVESCFRDEFVRRVGTEGEERGETCDAECVRCTHAAHDDGEDVDLGTWPVGTDGICEGCVSRSNQVGCLGEVVVSAVLPLPYLNFLNR